MADERLRLAILISGRGSNMRALVEACRDPQFPARVAVVVSNRPGAPGLDFAESEGIPAFTVDHKAYKTREEFERALDAALAPFSPGLICLAGFMRILSADFVRRHEGRILNIHPSLLPDYKGVDTHARVLADGKKVSGCSVHVVTAELDDGPVLLQRRVPVVFGDTPESLADRVLAEEHKAYPEAVALMARRLNPG